MPLLNAMQDNKQARQLLETLYHYIHIDINTLPP